MELVYCWGKNYVSLPNIDINFNPKFSFSFDESNGKLTFREQEESVNVFSHTYSNITNVTALVGKNGTGKTTFIHFLLDCFNVELSRGFGNIEFSYILVFNEKEKIIVYDNLSKNISPTMSTKYTFNVMPKATSTRERPYPPMCVVHYTNAFSFSAYRDRPHYEVSSQLYDKSLTCLLGEEEENDPTPDAIMRAYHKATKRQVAAWEKWERPSFSRPDLHLHMITAERGFYIVKEFIESKWTSINGEAGFPKTKLLSICQKIIESHRYIGRGITVLYGVVYSLTRWMMADTSWGNEDRDRAIVSIAEEWESLWEDQTQRHDADYILFFVKAAFRHFVGGEDAHAEAINGYRFVIDALLSEEFVDYSEATTAFRIRKECRKISLAEFYDNYLKANIYDFIVFDWGMSTGEFARFDLFSHIVAMGEKANDADINKRCSQDSFLFMLDEIDLYLHPKWQQSFLNDLLKDLFDFFHNQTVQIIFATHSPIFLSDIPNDNVIYFEKRQGEPVKIRKKEKKTFATNIYNLYHDSFFLKKNLGFMGNFAYKVLGDIHGEWEKYLSDKKEISKDDSVYKRIKRQWAIVDKIGEPVLRTMFQKMYIELLKTVTSHEGTLLTEYEIIMEFLSNLPKEKQEEMVHAIITRTGV